MDKEIHMLDAAKWPQGVVRTGLWISCQHQVLIRTTRQTVLYCHPECMLFIFEERKTRRLVKLVWPKCRVITHKHYLYTLLYAGQRGNGI